MSSEHKHDMSAVHLWLHVQSALLGVIFLFALVLNTLLILVLRKMKSRRSNKDCASYNIERSYMYLLFHLALADMLGVILNIPFDIFRNAGIVYYFTDAGCKILPPFQLASTTAQAGTYVALSYHRFRAIVHPIRAKLTVCKSLIMIAFIWLISTGLSLPYVIVLKFNATNNSCPEEWNKKSSAAIYTFAIFVVQYAAPVILMAVFYVSIARTLHEHRVAKELIHVPTQEDVRSHKHIVKMLVTIVTVYGVCMLPHHLFWIVTSFMKDVDKTAYDTISSVSYLFTYSNSVANPLVFFFYNKESRYHLKRFFKKLFCARTIDVPFEIKKWSATWSGVSRSDSQRPNDNRKNSKDLLKLDQLFPPRPGDSELGVSLPWEAQVMSSHASSESYRDYPASPPFPGVPISPEDPLEYTNCTTNPFVYVEAPQNLNPSETTLDTVHENEENGMDNNVCVENVSGEREHDTPDEKTRECDPQNCENEGSIGSAEECLEEGESENDQKEVLGNEDDGKIPWNEEETDIASDEDDTTRVQRMIERMMQDIRHELKQDGSMNGIRKLDDILNLNESLSNGEWDAINNGESVNDSLTHLGSQDLAGYQGNVKDISELREHLKSLPETRM